MARQARSEVTRQRIIAAAVDVFIEIGYPATNLGDIIERAQMTKGALYYHFDSKEALAAAIMEQTHDGIMAAFRSITQSSAPALESLIHGLFVTAEHSSTNKTARIGLPMLRTFAGINVAAERVYTSWLAALTELVDRAEAEGDLRPNLDTKDTAELLLETMVGAETLASTTCDLHSRVGRMWSLLLPAIVSEESLDYFREYLARESLRQAP